MGIKEKLVECISINLSKERYGGDPSKKDEFYIEAEAILKNLLLSVLIEKSKKDPLEYIAFLENIEEIMDADYYDVYFIESLVLGD